MEPIADSQALSKEALLEGVESFCRGYQLAEHSTLFRKGALVARHPSNFLSLTELDVEEKEALEYERDHKWAGEASQGPCCASPFVDWRADGSGSKQLYYAIAMCALGAAVQGWDQTGSNGANLSFPQEFGIATPWDQPGGRRDEWILGLVNSIPYLSAGLLRVYTSWISECNG